METVGGKVVPTGKKKYPEKHSEETWRTGEKFSKMVRDFQRCGQQ